MGLVTMALLYIALVIINMLLLKLQILIMHLPIALPSAMVSRKAHQSAVDGSRPPICLAHDAAIALFRPEPSLQQSRCGNVAAAKSDPISSIISIQFSRVAAEL